MSISQEVELLKGIISEANKSIQDASRKIRDLQSGCSHGDIEVSTYSTADCLICGKHLAWYCPTSPTLECDYEQDDGSYDEDCCRYCGEPEERK